MQLLTSLTFWRTRRDAQCILTCAINADLKSQPVARMCCQMSRCVAVWIECAASCPEIGYMPWKLCTIPLPVWPDILFLMVANSVCVAYRSVWLRFTSPPFDMWRGFEHVEIDFGLISGNVWMSLCVRVHMRPQRRGDCIWTSPLLVLPFNVYLCRFRKRSPLV